jgi:hypothetical protein
MRVRRVALVLFAAVLFVSCHKPLVPAQTAPVRRNPSPWERGEPAEQVDASAYRETPIPASVEFDTKDFREVDAATLAFRTEAHRKYLADPMVFAAVPDQGLPEGPTAVVGSRVCRFYPGAKAASTEDLASLPAGVPVPFGTILPITGGKAMTSVSEHEGMFPFQDNWNWFYPTRFKGQDGLVFGADLYGLNDSSENNQVSALLYRTGGRFASFYPILGYRRLSRDVVSRLARDRLAFQSVSKAEYELWFERPDDMIALYLKHRPTSYGTDWNRKSPVFVTTDLAAHAQHLVFDRLLQYVEETYFAPRLESLVEGFLEALKARELQAVGYRETLQKATRYFQVARAVLELAPDRLESIDRRADELVKYVGKDREAVLAAYPEEVRREITSMDSAAGFADSAVFTFEDGTTYREDYSQYRPRGHYTKNGVLSAYFRAMMWFGRIQFLIAHEGKDPLPTTTGQSSDALELTLAMEPIALLVTDLVKDDAVLFAKWAELFDPVTALIGLSDDLGFEELLPLWKDQAVGDFGAWAGSREHLLAFMELAHAKLRPPAISGSSVWWGPSEGAERRQPMGWRLFGQRFTLDSAIHHQVSPPRLMSRDMVRGLDIMKVFGSATADALLVKSDYPRMAGLEEKLDEMQKEFDALGADAWQKTYYDSVLFQVKTQAQFEPGAGFYFTESPAWGTRAMLAAHGTWAELRHDTILSVKQNYAERAGDGDLGPTFRTEPIPDPVHYLEPNVPFWQGSLAGVQNLIRTLDSFDLLDEESAARLGRFQKLLARAADVAATEALDQPVSKADLAWIPTIPAELARIVLFHVGSGESVDEEELKMAIIADVYTNAELAKVLEVGVGIPWRIYVPLNDGQGGKRIAAGYVFNYYEFTHPIGDRMTDEAWKQLVYDASPDLDSSHPFWAKGIALAPEPRK